MGPGKQSHLAGDRPNGGGITPVGPPRLVQDSLAHDLLCRGPVTGQDLLVCVCALSSCNEVLLQRLDCCFSSGLVWLIDGVRQSVAGLLAHPFLYLLVRLLECNLSLGLSGRLFHLILECDHVLVGLLCQRDSFQNGLLRYLV